MKLTATITTCCLVLSLLLGCNVSEGRRSYQGSPIEVVIGGDGQFPEELVGLWKMEGKSRWEFVFDKDGSISSAMTELCRAKIEPGQATTYPVNFGGKGIVEPGQWKVHYDPESRELAVEVVIEYFYQDIGPNAMEGNPTFFFAGTISADGKVWNADKFGSGKIVVLLGQGPLKSDTVVGNKVLADVSELESRGSVVFVKTEDEPEKESQPEKNLP